ncbi:hypothetical protein BKA61DRAFT_246408 [Leptodontidium sp. MPI-SDFR-AT-0119]|nr:hypothetical protein BKA61DRAFT_246408 [Leptodontidium sp. MPI-SDFR-AT-0119]
MASSSSVMAGLVCLCLEAAPGYISLAVSAHPRPPPTIASPLHTPFHTVLSSPSLELSTTPVTVAAILSFTKTLQFTSPRRPPHLYHHFTTRFYTHSSFAHLLRVLALECLGP